MPQVNKTRENIEFLLGHEKVSFSFNGDITPTTTLLQYLRGSYKYKGTKEGCNIGDCGACTIVIAELNNNFLVYKAVNSCLLLLPQIHGKQIITVEHLINNGHLHPVQKAMVNLHASQCGFCTPGFVMSMFSLYKQVNKPSLEDIQETFAGNLCRCTGYNSILKAAFNAFDNKTPDHFELNIQNTIKTLQTIDNSSALFVNKTQTYYTPNNLNDALDYLKKHKQATIVNGATDEAIKLSKQYESDISIIDLNLIKDLNRIDEDNNNLNIGALVNLQDLHEYVGNIYPTFTELLLYFGSKQIRNRATLSGNIAAASPIGDTLPFLMAINAQIKLMGLGTERIVPIKQFIIGYHKTDLKQNELITEIIIPKAKSTNISATYKVSKRLDLDISSVSIGVKLKLNKQNVVIDISVFYGGMAEITKPAVALANFLLNKDWNEENVMAASKLIEKDFNPISDARAEAEGRIIMAQNLFIKFWHEHE